jgi:hypothetical protein
MSSMYDELRSFLAEVQQVKAASSKKAEANTEAGSVGGGTSHPVKSVDDQTGDASEGARSSENTADVKKQVPAGGVDSANDNPPDQEDQQHDVGITSTATGEDPANEDNYKGTKDDPGTSHPAKTEDGEKYSSMNFNKLKGLTEKKANALLAKISNVIKQAELHGDQEKLDVNPKDGKITGSDLAALRSRKGETTHGKKEDEKKAAAVGYDQAVQSGEANEEEAAAFFKTASENMLRSALESATATGQYLTAFVSQLQKKAEEEEKEDAAHEEAESPAEEAAEHSPSDEGMASGGDIGATEGDLAAMGGEEMPAGGDEGSIDELLGALAEMGVSPDEVMAALSGEEGGDMGLPPEAGALPPEAVMAEAPKMAAAKANNRQLLGLVKAAKVRARSGKFQISSAKTAGQRKLRDEIKKCIAEIVG